MSVALFPGHCGRREAADDAPHTPRREQGGKRRPCLSYSRLHPARAPTPTTPRSGTAKLQQAQSILQETTEVGVNVMDTMERQRDTLIRATDKARGSVWGGGA